MERKCGEYRAADLESKETFYRSQNYPRSLHIAHVHRVAENVHAQDIVNRSYYLVPDSESNRIDEFNRYMQQHVQNTRCAANIFHLWNTKQWIFRHFVDMQSDIDIFVVNEMTNGHENTMNCIEQSCSSYHTLWPVAEMRTLKNAELRCTPYAMRWMG